MTWILSENFDETAQLLHPTHISRCIQEAGWIGAALAGKKSHYKNSPFKQLWTRYTGHPLIGPLREYQKALGRHWAKNHQEHACIAQDRWMDEYQVDLIFWSPSVLQSHRSRLAHHSVWGTHYRLMFGFANLDYDTDTSLVFLRAGMSEREVLYEENRDPMRHFEGGEHVDAATVFGDPWLGWSHPSGVRPVPSVCNEDLPGDNQNDDPRRPSKGSTEDSGGVTTVCDGCEGCMWCEG